MTQFAVTIQITSTSVPTTPPWLGEVAIFAQVMAHLGLLKAIQEQIRFARARFGSYDTIDFLVVLIGSMDDKLYAFKANGCGQTICSPLWTALTGNWILSSPAVANG